MTNAGWYPDPAGAPDTYRYWDGQAWSQMTTTHPASGTDRPADATPSAPAAEPTVMGPAPGSPASPPPPPPPPAGQTGPEPTAPYAVGGGYAGYGQAGQGGYGQPPQQGYGGTGGPGGYGQPPQQWGQTPPPGKSGSRTAIIVVAAVLALVLLGVAGFFGVRALTGDDEDSKADDPTSESGEPSGDASEGGDDPSVDPSTIAPTGIQCTGGEPSPGELDPAATTLTGGGLTIPLLPGYVPEASISEAFAFSTAMQAAYLLITDNWISLYAVGGLPKDNGFESTEQAAEIVLQCLTANPDVYEGFSGRTDLTREAITVDGKDAFRITAEVRVSNPDVTVEGDQTTVIVVDTGDPATYGVYQGVVPLGDDARIAEQEKMIGQIQVG